MDVWFGLVLMGGGLFIYVLGELRILRVRMNGIESRDVAQWRGQFQTNAGVKRDIILLRGAAERVIEAVVPSAPPPPEPIKENPELEDCHGAD